MMESLVQEKPFMAKYGKALGLIMFIVGIALGATGRYLLGGLTIIAAGLLGSSLKAQQKLKVVQKEAQDKKDKNKGDDQDEITGF